MNKLFESIVTYYEKSLEKSVQRNYEMYKRMNGPHA